MSITAVPISMRLVRAPIAASSGNGEASWRAKWWTRTNAPSSPSSSAASASSIVCTCASRAVRVRDPGASCQWPNERNPIRFTPATVPGAGREPTRTREGPGGGRGLRGAVRKRYEDWVVVVPLLARGRGAGRRAGLGPRDRDRLRDLDVDLAGLRDDVDLVRAVGQLHDAFDGAGVPGDGGRPGPRGGRAGHGRAHAGRDAVGTG